MGINCSFILCSCLSRGGKVTEVREGAPRDARRRREEKKANHFHDGVQLPHTVHRFTTNGPGAGASTAREKNRFGFSIDVFYDSVEGPFIAMCVVALTGLNEPSCVSSCLVIIYRGWLM